jgi:hypothetical protein
LRRKGSDIFIIVAEISVFFYPAFFYQAMSSHGSEQNVLDDLLVGLSVSRTNRERLRAVGGLEEDRGDVTSLLFSRASAASVRSGQPFEALSFPEDPVPSSAVRRLSRPPVEAPQSKIKHKIVTLPMDHGDFDLICGVAVGQGSTVCIASEC